jgi:AcrR family transcriptional regulator
VSRTARDTRTRILEATRRLLEERGFYAVGLEQVAKAAGVSRQAVYLKFGSKAGLLVALVHHIGETSELSRLLEWVMASPDALTALDRMAETVATYDSKILRIAMTFFDARRSDPEFEAAWRDRMQSRHSTMRRIADWLARDGVLARGWTVAEAADALWATASLPVADLLLTSRRWSKRRYARYLKMMMRRTFTTAGEGATRRRTSPFKVVAPPRARSLFVGGGGRSSQGTFTGGARSSRPPFLPPARRRNAAVARPTCTGSSIHGK